MMLQEITKKAFRLSGCLLLSSLIMGNIGCSDKSSKNRDVNPNKEGSGELVNPPTPENPNGTELGNEGSSTHLNLTIPRSARNLSTFCGEVPPADPQNVIQEYRFDKALINEKLAAGMRVWVHGAVPAYNHFVVTYRKEDSSDPMSFFKAQQFTVVPASKEVATTLYALKRHDELRIKGQIFENGSALVHLKVSAIDVVKKFESPTSHGYELDASLFKGKETAEVFAMVHALTYSEELGWALVAETKGMLLPVAVSPSHSDTVKKLYRGDVVNLYLKIRQSARGPVHFMTDDTRSDAVEVVDSILNCHDQKRVLEGTLVKFDKSPAISTDVYAVRVVDQNGIARNYTFFPASDLSEEQFSEVFFGVTAKAKKVWDDSSEAPVDVRNFREKPSIKVRAEGLLNVVSTEQANAQVYIHSIDQVQLMQTK